MVPIACVSGVSSAPGRVMVWLRAGWRGLLLAGLWHGGPALALGGLLLLDAPPESHLKQAWGASFVAQPAWGLQRSHSWWMPALELLDPSGAFVSTDLGLGWNLSQRSDVQAGWRWVPTPSHEFKGLPASEPAQRVGTRLERGAFCNWAPSASLLLQSGLRQGGGKDHHGLIAELGATSGLPLPGDELLGITAGVSWANRSLRRSEVGQPVAAAAGLPAGWHELQWALSHEHRFNAQWRLDTQLQWAHLIGVHAGPGAVGHPAQALWSLSLWKDWP